MKGSNQIGLFRIAFIIMTMIFLNLGCEPEVIIKKIPTYVECQAEPAPLYLPGDMIYGRVAGLKNCLPFVASAQAYILDDTSKLIGLGVKTYIDRGGYYTEKEIMEIGIKTDKSGLWPLIQDLDYQSYHTMDDIDVIEDLYMIDLNYEYNRMQLDTLDKVNQKISGWFQCRFILAYPQNASGKNPDTIIFNDCHFIATE